MSGAPPPQSSAIQIFKWLFWGALWLLAAWGAFFLGLMIYGEIQFAMAGCGPGRNWGETIYSFCSDIDETSPIFFSLGAPAVAPLCLALLVRLIARYPQSSDPS